MDTVELEKPAPGLLKTLVGIPLAVDKVVVGTGKGVISIVSPGLADRMVSIDHSFKSAYGDLVKRTANIALKIFGWSWK